MSEEIAQLTKETVIPMIKKAHQLPITQVKEIKELITKKKKTDVGNLLFWKKMAGEIAIILKRRNALLAAAKKVSWV